MGWDDLDCIDVVQVRDKWRARMNTVIILLVSIQCRKVPNYIRNSQSFKKDSAAYSQSQLSRVISSYAISD
jgi:hypothetical protein